MKTFLTNRILLSGSCKSLRLPSPDVLPRLLLPYLIKSLFTGIGQSRALKQYLVNNTGNAVNNKIINNMKINNTSKKVNSKQHPREKH